MSTAGAVLTRASRQLLSGTVEERNKLATTVSSADTSIVLSYDLGGFREGSIIEIESELMYVWESSTATKTLTVQRGYDGTTAVAHTNGVLATVNPRFPRQQMLDSLNSDIDDLSSTMNGLFRVVAQDITYNGSDRQINLTSATGIIDLIDVRLRYLADDYPVIRKVRLQRNLPTADFASGFAIVFDEPVMAGSLRVVTKREFTRASSESSDLQSACFVPQSCEDILEMGVLLRMMNGREIKRNFIESQGDTRRSDEVPAGSTRDSLTNIQRLRRERIIAEAARLKQQYPLVFRK
jgi:hypothetical protein